jgi:cytochrome c oxidase subunit II
MDALTSLNPQSPQTHAIFNLWGISGVIFALIFIVVTGIIVFSLMRFRWREGEPDPEQVAGNKRVEVIWTVIPLIIVIFLFVLTARTMSFSDPPLVGEPELIVIGHQWWWEARYPKSGVITANEIHIPTGRPISVLLDSADVLHEFWVAELTRKMSTVPGHPNHVWLQADRPGIYLGVCSEFCGTQHAWMRFTVVAQEPAEFAAWEQSQLASAATPDGDAAKGLALFKQMSCVSCHAIKGAGAEARVGPDLTHFASRKQFGSGIADNTRENLRSWLQDPQNVKPGVKMPNFKLSDEQISQFVAYFETLK